MEAAGMAEAPNAGAGFDIADTTSIGGYPCQLEMPRLRWDPHRNPDTRQQRWRVLFLLSVEPEQRRIFIRSSATDVGNDPRCDGAERDAIATITERKQHPRPLGRLANAGQ